MDPFRAHFSPAWHSVAPHTQFRLALQVGPERSLQSALLVQRQAPPWQEPSPCETQLFLQPPQRAVLNVAGLCSQPSVALALQSR